MKKKDYDVAVECYRNHKAELASLDDDRNLYKKVDGGLCEFEQVGRIADDLWTAREVRAYHEDKLASIFDALSGHMPCDMDDFCDECPIEEDCIGDKIFMKDAVEGEHFIKGKEVPKQ